MSVIYAHKTGGGVKLQQSYIVTARKLIDDRRRAYIWPRLREQLIAGLEQHSGLPFAIAITAIERWEEREETYQEWENCKYHPDDQPVLFIVTCYVKRVAYPQEAP